MNITIRQETPKDYPAIISLILRSFREGTDYSDGTDVLALVEEIRESGYYLPELSFVAEGEGQIVGHFLFSRFPLSSGREGGERSSAAEDLVLMAPVAVHAGFFRQGIGTAMLTQGIEKVKEKGYRGILVEGDYRFYNRLGFLTSSDYGIYPTSGIPLKEPRCMMCRETYPGSLKGIRGYVVYDMYCNA
ncbi:MAG: N-acetyltransferase [Provencibacterium sp.]|jgi:putative acetyltransferase|nr:N-acetyltransferase [Provencibacterium sp.]